MPPSRTEQLDTLYSTTWYSMRNKVVDQVFNSRVLWWLLNTNGRRTPQRGGSRIGVQLMYAKNNTFKSIGKFGTVELAPQDPITTAFYNWKYFAISITRDWQGDQQTRGEYEIINRMSGMLDQGMLSMVEKMGEQAWGDGTGNGAKDMDGLTAAIDLTPSTGVYAGIDPAVDTWWRNIVHPSGGIVNLFVALRAIHRLVSQGVDFPNLFLTTDLIFEEYENDLVSLLQITDRKMSDVGFENFKFKGVPITWDTLCGAGNLYALNDKYLKLYYDPDAEFAMTEWKPIPNQPGDRVAQVVWVGNLVTTQRRRQGVVTGLA